MQHASQSISGDNGRTEPTIQHGCLMFQMMTTLLLWLRRVSRNYLSAGSAGKILNVSATG